MHHGLALLLCQQLNHSRRAFAIDAYTYQDGAIIDPEEPAIFLDGQGATDMFLPPASSA